MKERLIAALIILALLLGVSANRYTHAQSAPVCPSGTSILFTTLGTMSVGQSTNFGGKLSSVVNGPTSIWDVADKEGQRAANNGYSLVVDFSSNVYLDSALIYDNDPKTGETPSKINGKSMPITPDNTWYPSPVSLALTTNKLTFAYGGDSPHFNICVKTVSTTPTNTPTKAPTATPTKTVTPTPTITKTPTPSPTNTTLPSATPNPTITSVAPTCLSKSKGDANCDGFISVADFEFWRREFNKLVTTKVADFNNNLSSDLIDFEIWRSNVKIAP